MIKGLRLINRLNSIGKLPGTPHDISYRIFDSRNYGSGLGIAISDGWCLWEEDGILGHNMEIYFGLF